VADAAGCRDNFVNCVVWMSSLTQCAAPNGRYASKTNTSPLSDLLFHPHQSSMFPGHDWADRYFSQTGDTSAMARRKKTVSQGEIIGANLKEGAKSRALSGTSLCGPRLPLRRYAPIGIRDSRRALLSGGHTASTAVTVPSNGHTAIAIERLKKEMTFTGTSRNLPRSSNATARARTSVGSTRSRGAEASSDALLVPCLCVRSQKPCPSEG